MMATRAKSYPSKLKDNFLTNLKTVFTNFTTISDTEVRDSVKRSERLTIVFQVVRNGLNQTSCESVNLFGYRYFKLIDWIIVITSLTNVLRLIKVINDSDETVGIYLGDFFFRSKDRLPCLSWTAMAIAIMLVFREWILNLEARGKFEELSIWKDYLDEISMTKLKMNKRNIYKFRLTIYFASLALSYTMKAVPLFVPILIFTPLLTNPWTYQIPRLAFFGTIWTITVSFDCIFLLNAILGFCWYIFCAFIFHLFRLLDLLDWADNLLDNSNCISFNENNIKSFCILIISRLNSFDFTSYKLRYLILVYIFVWSVVGDVYIYLGVIVRIYSDFLANLLAFIGAFILPSIGVAGFVFGTVISELDKLTIRLHQLTIKNKLSINTMFKVLEIMDRVAGPYNGVKIGDFFTLEKTFLILFILENISTLMLFTVNIGPLMQT